MSKYKALVLGILFTVCAIALLIDNVNPCLWPFAVAALLFLGLWFSKHQRDNCILDQTHQERQQAADTQPELPPMISSGSRQMFVPPPLTKKGE